MKAENREEGGKLVRIAWISWAQQQPNPKPSWLVPWEELSEADKEADRQIWEKITQPYRDRSGDTLKFAPGNARNAI